MNTGLTLDQFKEIVEFAQTYHEYKRFYEDQERTAIRLLYPKWSNLNIDSISYTRDTSDGLIRSVTIVLPGDKVEYFYDVYPDISLFDRIMQYLKGDIE